MIEFKNINKKYGKFTAIDNLNLKLEKGTITMLIGPSGCGKTTTLKMINRLIEPTKGDISINGESIFSLDAVLLRRKIGYVIQEVGLFPHMDVYNNIAVVPRLLKWNEKDILKRAEELLELVTLNSTYLYKYPSQLSGGERQRVGLARALAVNPDIILMDEPFGAIDPINRAKLHESFIEIQEEIQKTIAFVTHDINEAIKLGDNIVVLKAGKVEQAAPVEDILYKPANDFVDSLIGHDRSLKALSLKKARSLVQKKGYSIIPKGMKDSEILEKLSEEKTKRGFQLNEKGNVEKLFISEKGKINEYSEVPAVQRGDNLHEALSGMINIGENTLPVVNSKEVLIGVIHLNDILSEIRETN